MTRLRDVSGRRWIVAACENKVTLHDIASSHSLDISRSAAFESKAPTRLAFLLLNAPSLLGAAATSSASTAAQLLPIMAVGTSSGSIYLTNPTSAAVFAKLAGGHRGSITALLPFAAADGPMGPDRLLSASSDGSIAIWDPSRTATRGSDREFPPVRTFKAHDSGVRDAAFFLTLDASTTTAPPPSALTAVAGALQTVQARGRHKQDAAADSAADASTVHASAKTGFRLATVGDDRRLAVWDTSTWTETMRIQPFPKGVKATCHSLGFAPWGGAGLGLRPSLVMASGEVAAVLGFAPRTGEVTSLMDLAGVIDPGQKKVPKLYHMRVHPTR
jgi:WD40 repeat protein